MPDDVEIEILTFAKETDLGFDFKNKHKNKVLNSYVKEDYPIVVSYFKGDRRYCFFYNNKTKTWQEL